MVAFARRCSAWSFSTISRARGFAISSGATPRSSRGRSSGASSGARQRPDDVEQLLLGQPHQRPAQQRAERERVAPVGEDAGDRDEVLDFLAPVEALARLGGDGDAALFQRFLVAPEVAPGRRQQGDVSGPARAQPAVLGVGDRLAADQARAQLGDGLRLPRRAAALRIGLAVLVGHFDIQGGDRGSPVPRRPEGVEGLEAGLAVLLGKRGLEARVHVFHDRRAGAEVGGDREHGVRGPGAKRLARPDIGRDVGAAEAVDRLLGIADQEQRARAKRECRPVGAIAVPRRLAAEAPEYLGLQRVGVLELVDEDVAEARGQSARRTSSWSRRRSRAENIRSSKSRSAAARLCSRNRSMTGSTKGTRPASTWVATAW